MRLQALSLLTQAEGLFDGFLMYVNTKVIITLKAHGHAVSLMVQSQGIGTLRPVHLNPKP